MKECAGVMRVRWRVEVGRVLSRECRCEESDEERQWRFEEWDGEGWRVNSVMERRASGEGGREGKISLLSIAAYHLLFLPPPRCLLRSSQAEFAVPYSKR